MPTSPAVLPRRLLRDQESLKEAPLRVPANQLIVLSRTAQPEQRLAARTWNAFGGLLGTLSASLGIDPGAALAVMCVEAGGRCFGADGRLVIRFENHVFWQRCGGLSPDNEAAFHRHFRFDPRKKWLGHGFRTEPAAAWTAVHRSQASEWQALELARQLDDAAALCSASMGAPQIMGFHHARLGYTTVQAMFAAFADRVAGEREQLLSLFEFLRGAAGDSAMLAALRRHDYVAFARLYNGHGQAAVYGARLDRYRKCFAELCV